MKGIHQKKIIGGTLEAALLTDAVGSYSYMETRFYQEYLQEFPVF